MHRFYISFTRVRCGVYSTHLLPDTFYSRIIVGFCRSLSFQAMTSTSQRCYLRQCFLFIFSCFLIDFWTVLGAKSSSRSTLWRHRRIPAAYGTLTFPTLLLLRAYQPHHQKMIVMGIFFMLFGSFFNHFSYFLSRVGVPLTYHIYSATHFTRRL